VAIFFGDHANMPVPDIKYHTCLFCGRPARSWYISRSAAFRVAVCGRVVCQVRAWLLSRKDPWDPWGSLGDLIDPKDPNCDPGSVK